MFLLPSVTPGYDGQNPQGEDCKICEFVSIDAILKYKKYSDDNGKSFFNIYLLKSSFSLILSMVVVIVTLIPYTDEYQQGMKLPVLLNKF